MDMQENTTAEHYEKKSLSAGVWKFFFSTKGSLGRLDYLGVTCIFNLVLEQAMKFDCIYADICAYMMFFSACIAAVQKRCRDIKIKGTFFILIFSVMLPIIFYLKYIRLHQVTIPDNWKVVGGLVIFLFFVCYAILLLFPGNNEKNTDLTSVLLKYPYIYLSVCFIFYLIGFYQLIQFSAD